MNPRRSASVGALPREKKHFVSRNESASGISLDVRCACQYFQCDSLLPERINPVDSRPSSQLGFHNELSAEEEEMMLWEASQMANQHTETAPVVDLSFVELHPELEETAKKRGLVVSSISDAHESDQLIARSRGRQMSVGAVSAGSGRRELDNMSAHSVASLRRLPSRSPSRKDLFIADINIPSYKRGSSASASVSRRTSTADLSPHAMSQRSSTPMLLNPTQSSNELPDYRRAKTPLSTDYMRPSDNAEIPGYVRPLDSGEVLPQHRPIHIEPQHVQRAPTEMADVKNVISDFELVHSRGPSPMRQTAAPASSVVHIEDKIELQTTVPPVEPANDVISQIVYNKETEIDVVRKDTEVNIEQLVQEEEAKVKESRMSPNPPPRRRQQLSPAKDVTMNTLELPTTKPTLKRQHTPEPEPVSQLPEEAGEVKSSYTARFKAMFSKDSTAMKRQRSASPVPKREKSPSPNKLMSMFSKNKETAIEIMSGSNAAVSAKPEADVIAGQMSETFSLKVDEMDQYSCKPKQSPAPSQINTPLNTTYNSREDFGRIKSGSSDIYAAFSPVILPRESTEKFFAGSRNLYSADIDINSSSLPQQQRSDFSSDFGSNFHIPKGALISLPINITQQPKETMYRYPSEQIDIRTQSQDRAGRNRLSEDDISTQRMTKTVSFNFDERQSRLGNYETAIQSQQKQQQFDYLERSYFSRDHEYEPIGVQSSAVATAAEVASETQTDSMQQAEDLQKDFEERYFSSETTTPRTESRTDYEIHTSQIDSSALEELPLKPENRKKGFMATAQDRTRRMQVGFKTQAGKIKTKLRAPAKKPATATESPKVERRKRFKAPEFSKIKMPEIKRPDMSKFKEFKRPEFTKFNTPDMSKYKISDKFSIMKLRRSKSFKENETSFDNEPEPEVKVEQKKMFDFNFGTYPRAFRKKKAPVEPQLSFGTEEPSVIPSTETQPSMDSSSSPKGDRGPGPVRSRWADKFSDVSYNDSEGSRYRRYESELGSFDRDSLLERRMKDDLEDTGSEVGPDLGILSGEGDTRQFAEFDEENRAIHEISSQRAKEFKRRPMVHQDSDLRSEDSKDLGWTEKEIQKNKLLRKAELEAEASYLKYPSEERRDDTVSTASSGKKVVMEQIDDDEFFLRKRGVSEDNIEFRQYISNAIRQGYDMPINALQHVGNAVDDFEAAPPKPRRLHKPQRAEDVSQEFQSRSEYGDDLSISQNGSDFYPPKRPLRKGRSRSKYSVDSQDIPLTADHFTSRDQYFDDDEEYLKPPLDQELNNLDKSTPTHYHDHPQPPRRRKRRESSMDKDSYVNGLTGRSVSSSYLQPNEDVIVYRTEHQYPVPLATPENYTDASRSMSRFDDGEGTHEVYEKYVIDMMENDGYATVRKEQIPKPTPPARRKKFSRTPGERLKRSSTSPPERPPPPQQYSPSVDVSRPLPPRRKSAQSLETPQNFEDGDYEDPAGILRPESPRNLHSGDVINKMKYRPLPAPPRPPREKRLRGAPREPFDGDESFDDRDGGGERIASSSTADSYEQNDNLEEVEASTQTDPLPDDFICEEFEITPDMKIIEPRRPVKTLAEILREAEEQALNAGLDEQLTEDEQLAKGLQRFREANQRSVSERSRVSSHSLSRPQTPSSAIIIERRVSSPVPSTEQESIETAVAASLIVHPIQDLDLEEAELRREGLLTDSSQHSKIDEEEHEEYTKLQAIETEQESEVESSVAKEDSEAEQKSRFSDYYEKDSADEHDIAMISKIDVQSELERIRREEQADIQRLQNEMDALLQTSTEQQNLLAEAAHKDEEENILMEEAAHKDEEENILVEAAAPQPPPRRRSSVNMELPAATAALVEQQQFPTHIADLEVERLRVNALQAGQIMVGQFHGAQVSADELECKSGNLIVHHLELPPGFIEDIVGKVRSSERAQLLSSETQTSEHASRELLPTTETETDMEMETFTQRSTIPPPKPPRQRELTLNTATANAADNLDEETQTEGATSSPNMVPVFPTIEYLQSLAPLAFYNLERQTAPREHTRSHHHYHRCESSGSDLEDIKDAESDTTRRRRQRTCSSHASTSTQAAAAAEAQSLAQASRQFISACSMSLINTINKLTSSLDNEKGYGLEQGSEARPQQRAQMILLLAVLIFAFFLFMMSGRNVHTHHWDYFNPPGNEGRPS